jgi:hypothetical protein
MDRIDRALATWPIRERTSLDRDETAAQIASRAASEEGLPWDASLLSPPSPATPGERGRRIGARWWTAVAGIAAVTAVASAMMVGSRRDSATATPATAAGDATASARAQPRPPPPAAVDDRAIDPSDLPRVASGDRRATPAASPRAGGTPKAAVEPAAVPATANNPAIGVTEVPSAADTLRPAAATAAGSGLSGAVDSVPLKPSAGAIQSALATAGRAARACLAPGEAPSRATVTFRSDGSVSDVTVSGDSAGTQGNRCVRAALAGARVTPFAEPSFTAPVTVRPN